MTHKDPPTTHALSLTALLVGSLSSAATAVVVHRFWRAGAILGAAATPVLVALFGELLRRPIDRINDHTVRLTGPRPVWVGPSGAEGQMRVYRARPPWQPAIATGLLAFALGVTALTGSELLLDRSVGDPRDRTTLFDPGPGAFTQDGGERPAAEAVTRPQPAPRVARRGPTELSRAGRRQRPHTVRARAGQVAPLSEPASAGARSGAASPTSPPRRTTTRTTTALPPSTTTTAPPEDPAASTSTVPEDGASSAPGGAAAASPAGAEG